MTVFPLVISWFLTFGYVPTMSESANGNLVKIDDSRIATVAQIGLSAETNDGGLFKVYTDIENFQYAPDGSGGANFSPLRKPNKKHRKIHRERHEVLVRFVWCAVVGTVSGLG